MAAFAPSPAQRIGTISVVVLLHLAVFLYRGIGPSSQSTHVARVTTRSSVSVVLAPLAEPPTPSQNPADRKQVKGAAETEGVTTSPPPPPSLVRQPEAIQATLSSQPSPGPAPSSTNEAQAAHAQSQQEAGAPAAPTADADADPDYSRNPAPAYPPASRRSREEGRVLLSVLVSADGVVKEASVETSSGYLRLDEAALEAVRRWIFLPAKRGGVAIAARIRVPVNFVLSP